MSPGIRFVKFSTVDFPVLLQPEAEFNVFFSRETVKVIFSDTKGVKLPAPDTLLLYTATVANTEEKHFNRGWISSCVPVNTL